MANLSFTVKMRDELLSSRIFGNMQEAKILIERWHLYYNAIRTLKKL